MLSVALFLALLAAPALAKSERTADIVYGQGYTTPEAGQPPVAKDLLLDALVPTEGEGLPALIMLHGGSFMNGSKAHSRVNALAEELAARGVACFIINYRLVRDAPPAPAPFNFTLLQQAIHAAFVDARTAIRFVRANAARFRVDPARVGILGESAGAFAAIAAGVGDPGDYLVDDPALPALAGNHLGVDTRPGVVVDLWGNAELVMGKFSADDPPMMIVHGKEDDHVGTYFGAALNIKAACEKAGIRHRFYPVEGAKHGCWTMEADGKKLAELIVDFVVAEMPPRVAP